MTWNADDPPGNEALKVKYDIAPFTRGRVLDLGAGMTRTYPHFTTVDNLTDTRLFGHPMKPDVVVDTCENLALFGDESWDAVFSSHLLEHIADTHAALAEWWRVVKVGGHLVLYLPHKDFYPNIGKPGSNPDHKHDFLPEDIVAIMRLVGGWDLLVNEDRNEAREYSFLQIYRKRSDDKRVLAYRHKPEKTACVVRFGGFGDHMMAANVLPGLKRQGYSVTYMTVPKGADMLKHDPHIDAFLVQDKDQVPNHELGEYFKVWAKRFDRFVNLCEAVEGTLLAMPGRVNHQWPLAVRQKRLGTVNYLEHHADLAGVPLTREARFYASEEEERRAQDRLFECGPGAFVAMWVLAGSSVHKVYPHMDAVVGQIMARMPNAHVIFVGDETCKLLEQGWENEPRVHRLCGELGIRDTIALAQKCDLVIGPETGVLNALAFESVPKVCLMSHSSVTNLTRDWENTASLEPREKPPCYPCHQLHYGNEFCTTDRDTGCAWCQIEIHPADVWDAVVAAYERAREVAEAA